MHGGLVTWAASKVLMGTQFVRWVDKVDSFSSGSRHTKGGKLSWQSDPHCPQAQSVARESEDLEKSRKQRKGSSFCFSKAVFWQKTKDVEDYVDSKACVPCPEHRFLRIDRKESQRRR